MPHQFKGKLLPSQSKIIVLDIEIVKIVKNQPNHKSDDEPPKQHFQVFIANPSGKHIHTTQNTKQG